MDAVGRLTAGLIGQQGVIQLDVAGAHGDAITAPGLAFIGAKDHWGSVGLVGIARGESLSTSSIKGIVDEFERLTHELHRYAGVLTIFSRFGASSVKLGSFGVLCFVFERGFPQEMVAFVKGQRRGSAAKKEYVLCWSIDVEAGRVHDHGLLPRGVFPQRKWVEGILRT